MMPGQFRSLLPALAVALAVALWPLAGAAPLEYANIDAGASGPPLTIPAGQSTPDFNVGSGVGGQGNSGDYIIQIGASTTDDWANGILHTNVRENGRGSVFAISMNAPGSSTFSPGGYFVPITRAGTGNDETNSHIAAAYFPFSGGWAAGAAYNSTNGGPITSLNASPGINLGTQFIDSDPGPGQFKLFIPGVADTRAEGLLFVNGAKNENNFALSAPSASATTTAGPRAPRSSATPYRSPTSRSARLM